jgi:hypothetical protein
VIAGPLHILDSYYEGKPAAARDTARAVQIHNLRVLQRHGVPIAVGSDTYGTSARPEAAYMAELGVFSPRLIDLPPPPPAR